MNLKLSDTMILLLLVILSSAGFSQKLDTVFQKSHYSHMEFYPCESARMSSNEGLNESKILCFGNYIDTLKNGPWVYFYPNGKILAKGKYKDGFKIGTWKYYVTEISNDVIFSKNTYVRGQVVIDDKGWPKIIDKVNTGNSYYTIENGRTSPHSRVCWLD